MPAELDAVLDRCRRASIDDVRRWKAETGGKAVGCFPVYVPCELFHAAGLRPVGVRGGGSIETDRADSRLQSFICSIARSTLELGLRRDLACLDGMVFPNICDVSKNLAGVWKRNFPDQRVEYVHYPQNPDSRHALEYLVAEFDRLTRVASDLTGRPVSDRDLRASIEIFNRNRALVRELYGVRRERPWDLTAAEAAAIVRAGRYLAPEEHAEVLETALDAAGRAGRRPHDGLRVVIEGAFCEPPPLELLETIEGAGCFVVGDDLELGARWFDRDVGPDGDALRALAEAYLKRSTPTSVRHLAPAAREAALREKLRRAGAEGVLFCTAKFCEPALFDFALLRAGLERDGVPVLAIEFEEKMSAFESVRSQVETFVEASLFFS